MISCLGIYLIIVVSPVFVSLLFLTLWWSMITSVALVNEEITHLRKLSRQLVASKTVPRKFVWNSVQVPGSMVDWENWCLGHKFEHCLTTKTNKLTSTLFYNPTFLDRCKSWICSHSMTFVMNTSFHSTLLLVLMIWICHSIEYTFHSLWSPFLFAALMEAWLLLFRNNSSMTVQIVSCILHFNINNS